MVIGFYQNPTQIPGTYPANAQQPYIASAQQPFTYPFVYQAPYPFYQPSGGGFGGGFTPQQMLK